jgi:hypothetical protein
MPLYYTENSERHAASDIPIPLTNCVPPNVVLECLAFLRIREVPGPILGPEAGYSD